MKQGIRVLGLGPGDPNLIVRGVWRALEDSNTLYLRTDQHPAVPHLPSHLKIRSFDYLYDSIDRFELLYDQITQHLIDALREDGFVQYAVPGDPTIGEATVQALRQVAHREKYRLEILHGVSFIEPCLAILGLDGLEGLTIYDALSLAAGHHPQLNPDLPSLVGQLYSRSVASDVKLTLMNQYPDDYALQVILQAGSPDTELINLPLYELDRLESINAMTALYIPPLEQPGSFEGFQETVAHLRAPDGCPWDREQTHSSLRPHLLEEAYEAIRALDERDIDALKEELGDLLLQIVIQVQIASEGGEFTMPEVIAGIQDKLIRRHPHVFGNLAVENVEEVLRNWESLKAQERAHRGEDAENVLSGVPRNLPALAQASELQRRAARVGFDWPDMRGVGDKIREELEEFMSSSEGERAEEFGDLMFALVNLARWLELDPEAELQRTNRKFRKRFSYIVQRAGELGKGLQEMTLEEMDSLWEESKLDDVQE